MEFIGNNNLTWLLRQRVLQYNPLALAPGLHNMELEAADEMLARYQGDFIYIHVSSGMGYATFVVRTPLGQYVFRIYDEDLPPGWQETVPSIPW